ncbi:hypothetical protein, partial [Actinocorallia cavernae]|uniref:hypothetical protein n=1 Tax=Actinocorallia cavernae TaxID=328075 RepID=UPI0031F88EC2
GYVSFHGLQLLVPALRQVVEAGTRVRLLLGAEPTGRAALIELAGDPAAADGWPRLWGKASRHCGPSSMVSPPARSSAWRLHEIRQWLHHPLVECRRWEHRSCMPRRSWR